MYDTIVVIERNIVGFVFILTAILDCVCNGCCVRSMPIPASTQKNSNDTDAKKDENQLKK